MVLRPSSCPRFLSAPRRRVYPHVGFSRATRTMSSRMSFAVGGRPGLRFLLPSYLAAMRQRYQRRSVAGVATDAIWASASRPKAWALTASLRRSSSESLRRLPVLWLHHEAGDPVLCQNSALSK